MLVRDDRAARVRHLGLALLAEARLDLLQPVAREGVPDALVDHAVQVDERLVPQQVVDLVLAGAVRPIRRFSAVTSYGA